MRSIRKQSLVLAAACCVGTVLVTTGAWAFELPNASMEKADASDPTKPAGWEPNKWGNIVAKFTWSDDAVDGKKSLRIDVESGTEGDAKWWSSPVAVPAGLTLQVANRYKSDVTTRMLIRFENQDKKSFVQVTAVPASPDKWGTASGIVAVPAWAKGMRVMQVLDKKGFVQTDAWNVSEAKPGDVTLPPKGKIPLVSISFDDGWISAYNLLIKEMDKRGLRGTHFIVADFIDKEGFQADYIGKKKIIELLKNKHEIGSHTWDHTDLKTLSKDALDKNLGDSKKRIEEMFDIEVVGTAPPYGSYDEATLPLLKKHYKYSRTVKGGLNDKPYKTHELYTIVVHHTMPLTEFASWVTKAAVEGKWLILLYHRAAKVPPSASFVTPGAFIQQMDYLVKAGADVKPIGEVMGIWKPKPVVIKKPDIETGLSLAQPDAVPKYDDYEDPVKPLDTDCSAAPTPAAPLGILWLLGLAIAIVLIRRPRHAARVEANGDGDDIRV